MLRGKALVKLTENIWKRYCSDLGSFRDQSAVTRIAVINIVADWADAK